VQEYNCGIGMTVPVTRRVQQVSEGHTWDAGSGGHQPQGTLQEQVAARDGGHGDPHDAGRHAGCWHLLTGGARTAVTRIVPGAEKQLVQLADVRAAPLAEQPINALGAAAWLECLLGEVVQLGWLC
jgi:hypothetical protein